jgi:hypothetical protein
VDSGGIPEAVYADFIRENTPRERVEVAVVATSMGMLNKLSDGLRAPLESEFEPLVARVEADTVTSFWEGYVTRPPNAHFRRVAAIQAKLVVVGSARQMRSFPSPSIAWTRSTVTAEPNSSFTTSGGVTEPNSTRAPVARSLRRRPTAHSVRSSNDTLWGLGA